LDYIEEEYSEDRDDISDMLEKAVGLDHLSADKTPEGQAFAAAYQAKYTSPPSNYAMYAYDTVYMYAHTLDSMIQRGDDFHNGKDITDGLRAVDF
jgi:ABC-type branched-subunit amino acid transport system substrate-binding protein